MRSPGKSRTMVGLVGAGILVALISMAGAATPAKA